MKRETSRDCCERLVKSHRPQKTTTLSNLRGDSIMRTTDSKPQNKAIIQTPYCMLQFNKFGSSFVECSLVKLQLNKPLLQTLVMGSLICCFLTFFINLSVLNTYHLNILVFTLLAKFNIEEYHKAAKLRLSRILLLVDKTLPTPHCKY